MRRSKQDSNPTVGRNPYNKTTDSPPSLSMTASPDKTTEKKTINMQLVAAKQKMAAEQDKLIKSLPF